MLKALPLHTVVCKIKLLNNGVYKKIIVKATTQWVSSFHYRLWIRSASFTRPCYFSHVSTAYVL